MNIFLRVSNHALRLLGSMKFAYRRRYLTACLRSVGTNFRPGADLIAHGLENVSIGDNFVCGERLKLRTFNNWGGGGYIYNPNIIIGNNVNIESDCHISAINSVVIEDDVLIASFVFISDMAHESDDYSDLDSAPLKRSLFSKGPIHICKNVWIGEKATILPGVTIGESSIIGANSVVTKDIPPFSIAVGSPARVIKTIKQ